MKMQTKRKIKWVGLILLLLVLLGVIGFLAAEAVGRNAMTGKTASYHQYLWTKRLSMSEKEYVEFLRNHEEAYEDSVEMEDYLEKISSQWERSHNGMLMAGIQKEKEMRRIAEYQNKLTERVDYLKDAYREMIN